MVKKVGGALYVHKSNCRELVENLDRRQQKILIKAIDRNYDRELRGISYSDYAIIKYNTLNDNVSLIESHDWDYKHEPTVGDSYCYTLKGELKIVGGGSKVYHSKWMFVAEDYRGFDITESKIRTQTWERIDSIDKNMIGNKGYWENVLQSYGIKG